MIPSDRSVLCAAGVRVTLATLAILFIPLMAQADGPADAVGKWKMVTSFNGRDNESEVVFELKDGALTGTATGRRGSTELLDVKFENGTLSWGIVIPRAGNEPLRTTVTLNGNSFEGSLKTPLGDAPVRGTRWTPELEQQAAEKLKAILGDWDIVTAYQGKETASKMRLYFDDDHDLRLSFLTPGTALEIRRVRFDGSGLEFAAVMPFLGDEPARGLLSITDGKLDGKISGPLGEIPIRGSLIDTAKLVLAPYDDPKAVLGNWDVVATVNGKESKARFSVVPDGERLKCTLQTGDSTVESKEVDYKKLNDKMGRLRVTILIPSLGEKPQEFEIIFNGDTFEGDELHSNGNIYLVGSRAAG